MEPLSDSPTPYFVFAFERLCPPVSGIVRYSKCVSTSTSAVSFPRRAAISLAATWESRRGGRASKRRGSSRARSCAPGVGARGARVNGTISSTARAIISSTMRHRSARQQRVSWRLRSALGSSRVDGPRAPSVLSPLSSISSPFQWASRIKPRSNDRRVIVASHATSPFNNFCPTSPCQTTLIRSEGPTPEKRWLVSTTTEGAPICAWAEPGAEKRTASES